MWGSLQPAVCYDLQCSKGREEAETELEAMLQEAEDSGPATGMTAEDWAEVAKQGLRRPLLKRFDRYLIFYRLLDDDIEVLRVVHGGHIGELLR